ncbi:hypothetical protein E2C01_014083 [Portunus trituberculatus]|uniref:Uncharacterized protein n=1 Tax=Portunus trituberculatus TaxID=210409 RepID=A0A5B7DI80_PORTR|nr:hypothetical protein [Portunus trituberculatus]
MFLSLSYPLMSRPQLSSCPTLTQSPPLTPTLPHISRETSDLNNLSCIMSPSLSRMQLRTSRRDSGTWEASGPASDGSLETPAEEKEQEAGCMKTERGGRALCSIRSVPLFLHYYDYCHGTKRVQQAVTEVIQRHLTLQLQWCVYNVNAGIVHHRIAAVLTARRYGK